MNEYGLLPGKTYICKSENCHWGKCSKEQLTILIGINMNSKVKLPILIIGKSKNLKCFLNVKSLSCKYDSKQEHMDDNCNLWSLLKEVIH